jgi:hypothetical protein
MSIDFDQGYRLLQRLRDWVNDSLDEALNQQNKVSDDLRKKYTDLLKTIRILESQSLDIPREVRERRLSYENALSNEGEEIKNILDMSKDILSLSKEIKYRIKKANKLKHGTKRGPSTKLKVRFENGPLIQETTASKTFIEALDYMGLEKVADLRIICRKQPLVSKEEPVGDPKKTVNGYDITLKNSTKNKADYLEQIAKELGYDIIVDII